MVDDPLGLTPEQRQQSDLWRAADQIMENRRRNLDMISDLPPGTVIEFSGWPGWEGRRLTREEALEVLG